jgi:hypothetical protein
MGNGLAGEMRRRKTKAGGLRELLADGRWHMQQECQDAGGFRYGARIFDMRKKGVPIETEDLGGGAFRFRMVLEGSQAARHRAVNSDSAGSNPAPPAKFERDGQALLF